MDVSVIFSVIFFLIVALGAYRGFRRAKKKGLKHSVTRFVIILLSALISILVARAVAVKISKALYTALADGTLPQQITDVFNDLPSAPAVILALVCMILAPILFYPINSIIKLILKLISPLAIALALSVFKLISKAFAGKSKKNGGTEDNAAPEAEEAEQFSDASSQPDAAEVSEAVSDDISVSDEITDVKKKAKKPKKQKRDRHKAPDSDSRSGGILSVTFGILAGVLSVFIFFAPILAGLGIIGMIEDVASGAEIAEVEEIAPALEIAHGCTHNAAVSVSNALGGKLMFNALTTFKVNGEKIALYNELELVCGIAETAFSVYDEEKTAEQKTAALDGILPLFDKSSIIPIMVSEFLAGAAEAWDSGDTFCGISLPVDKESPLHDMLIDTLAVFKDSTAQTVREDVATVIKIASVVVKNDVVGNSPENPAELLDNRKLVSDLLFEVFENTRLKILVDSLANTGIRMMTSALSVPESFDGIYNSFLNGLKNASGTDAETLQASFNGVFRRYGIDITEGSLAGFTNSVIANCGFNPYSLNESTLKTLLKNIDINKKETVYTADLSTEEGYRGATLLITAQHVDEVQGAVVSDSRAEADALAEVFASVSEVTDLFSGEGGGVSSTVKSFGKILDKLAACGTIGRGCVDSLLVALIQSDSVYDTLHMDKVEATHFANAIVDGAKSTSYSAMMDHVSDVVDAMTKSSQGELDKSNMESVISSLTPETATALGHLVSDNLVENMGFGAETASGVSGMLTNVFDNIAEVKKNNTMDDATYAEESRKIAELIDVTMTISENKSDSVDIDSYVDNVMSSTIVTDSLCESVYADGDTPIIDPLNSGMNLSDSDKDSLVNNLQSKLDAADAADKDATARNAVAVAAYMNVKVEIVNGIVTIPDAN